MSDTAGLYVHIPFCSLKCFYCDFTAVAHHGHLADRYLRAIASEFRSRGPRSPDTVYVGGGTPSELSASQIRGLFAAVPIGQRETTFECNPESLTPEKLDALAVSGVTRLSIGLQTHDDALLKAIGRRHTARQFEDIYRAARERFQVSVDLMYSLPGQSVRSLRDSLDFVRGLDPDHVSLYGLQVEDQTLFAKRGVEADEDQGRAMFELALDRLAASGYRHYEISNWAKPGRESKHNLTYWRDGEYVGLGCGAASFAGGKRSTNVDRLVPYMDAIEAGKDAADESERLEGKAKIGESLLLGLRLMDGIEPTREMREAFASEIDDLVSRGLLLDRGRLRLSKEGLFLANQVFRAFVRPYAEAAAAS